MVEIISVEYDSETRYKTLRIATRGHLTDSAVISHKIATEIYRYVDRWRITTVEFYPPGIEDLASNGILIIEYRISVR